MHTFDGVDFYFDFLPSLPRPFFGPFVGFRVGLIYFGLCSSFPFPFVLVFVVASIIITLGGNS